MIFRNLLAFFFLVAAFPVTAQNIIKGKVNNYTYDTLTSLPSATVTNITSNISVVSDNNGYYSIQAKEKDRIVFSHTGFMNDSVTVEAQFFISGYDAALIERSAFLRGVTVTSSYRRDSIRRRNEYSELFEKQPGITGGNTPSAGAGIVLSPFSYFSKDRKEKKLLKQRILKQEEEAYIDHVFSPEWVSTLTGLKGTSLQSFMNKYRPSYEFCRQRTRTEMIVYLSDKLKEFKKEENVQ